MPSISADRLRHIKRIAVEAEAVRDRLSGEIADVRDDLRRLELQQSEARKAPAPPPRPAPPEAAEVGPRSGAAPRDAQAHANARVAEVKAQLAELRDSYAVSARKAGRANTLWNNCRDHARAHGYSESTFELEATSHAQ